MTTISIVCSTCGSPEIRRDAWAFWDQENQWWELAEIYDHAFCESCGGETTLTEKEVTPVAFPETPKATILNEGDASHD